MAKKTTNKKSTKLTNEAVLEDLVNEGKNVDAAKIEEIISENIINDKEDEENKFDNGEILDGVYTEDKTNIEENNVLTLEKNTDEELNGAEVDDIKDIVETVNLDAVSDEQSIDDVIAECTGEVIVNTEEKPKKESEPWYVARAKRLSDYYNW